MKIQIMLLAITITLGMTNCKKEGCTDVNAENYKKKAKVDDGSCTYKEIELTENITTATTFNEGTVKVCGNIYVSADLTLKPGVKLIMCADAMLVIESTGSINAVGTSDKPIVIKGSAASSGYWVGIAIKSNNPANEFAYVTVSDAGSYWAYEDANVYLGGNAKLKMSNSTISNSKVVGMYVDESATLTSFQNNVFESCVTGLSISAKQVSMLDVASNYNSGNTNNYVLVRSASLTQDATWKNISTPYLINNVSTSGILTIEAGATCMFEADGLLKIESAGSIRINGTNSSRVILKGKVASAGYWQGLVVSSNNINNKVAYAAISDGGSYWYYDFANIYVSGRVDLDNSSVSNANSYGVVVAASASIYSNGTVQTTVAGLEGNNTFSGNGVGADANCTNGCKVLFK